MSLLHQALKKLESERTGYDSALRGIPAEKGRRPLKGWRPFLIAAVVVLALISALYYSRLPDKSSSGTRAVKTAPSATEAPAKKSEVIGHNQKGVELFRAGKVKEAAAEFSLASSGGVDPVRLNNLGVSYLELGENDKAEAAFKKALEQRGDYPEALNNYGSLLYKRGENRKAESFFKKAISLAPGYPDPHLNLAILLETDGKKAEAAVEYERYAELGGDRSETARKKALRLRSSFLNDKGPKRP